MKEFSKFFIIAFLFVIFVNQANAEVNEDKVSVYLHPTMFSIAFPALELFVMDCKYNEEKNNTNYIKCGDRISFFLNLMLYSTIEIPINLSNSFIIQPSLWLMWEMSRVGSGFGIRHFLNGKGDGWYLQAMSSFYRYSYLAGSDFHTNEDVFKKGFYADLLGYVGYSFKKFKEENSRVFLDFGIGTLYPSKNIDKINGAYVDKPFKNLLIDVNFGAGFSIL